MSPVRPLARLDVRRFCNAQRARPMRVLAGGGDRRGEIRQPRGATRHAMKTGPAWLFDGKRGRRRPIE
jgi:hypothetical protein